MGSSVDKPDEWFIDSSSTSEALAQDFIFHDTFHFNSNAETPYYKLTITNTGRSKVENIRIVVNGKRDWYDLDSLINEVTWGEATPLDQALSLYWLFHEHNVPVCDASPLRDPVIWWNSFGFGCCGDSSVVLERMLAHLGIGHRRSLPLGHAALEYWISGAWRHLDPDKASFYLDRDNLLPVGANDIRRDHYLIRRVPHDHGADYGVLRPDENFRRSPLVVSALYPPHVSDEPPTIRDFPPTAEINIALQPGQSFYWLNESVEPLYNYYLNDLGGRLGRSDLKQRMIEARHDSSPDFSTGFSAANGWVKLTGLEYSADNLGLMTKSRGGAGTMEIVIPPMYPVTALHARVYGQNISSVALRLPNHPFPQEPATGRMGEWIVVSAPFVPVQQPWPMTVALDVKPGLIEWNRMVVTGLDLQVFMQVARFAAPEFRMGDNEVVYSGKGAEQKMKIGFGVNSASKQKLPAPAAYLYPPDGAVIHDSQPIYFWASSSAPPGKKIAGYYFQLSEFADMRRPLSPNFDRHLPDAGVGREPFYRLPLPGLLHPGKTYYWRVRAIDEKGNKGEWGPVSSFTPKFPGYPTNLRYEVEDNLIYLMWDEPVFGEKAVEWDVHGSDEFGFVPADEPYVRLGFGTAETPVKSWGDFSVAAFEPAAPPTLLGTVTERRVLVVAEHPDTPPGMNKFYYRVVAVDVHGQRGMPSETLSMPDGHIYSRNVYEIYTGTKFEHKVLYLRDRGPISVKPGSYFAGLWNQPEYEIKVDNLPDWLTFDQSTATISGMRTQGSDTPDIQVTVFRDGRPVSNQTISRRRFF